MNSPIADRAASETTAELLKTIELMKEKECGSLGDILKSHMIAVIVNYLNLVRSQSPGEFSVETDKNTNLDMRLGVKVRIVSNNLEYVGYIEEINILDKNKHLIN